MGLRFKEVLYSMCYCQSQSQFNFYFYFLLFKGLVGFFIAKKGCLEDREEGGDYNYIVYF